MQQIFQWLIAAAVLFGIFLAMVFISWRNKRRKLMMPAIIVFMMAVSAAAFAGILFLIKSFNTVKRASYAYHEKDDPYRWVFGAPGTNCVKLLQFTDQVIPRLDCCIWMEFNTCAPELKRIIQQKGFEQLLPGKGTDMEMPDYSPRPEWFRPRPVKDSLLVFRHHNPDNPNFDEWLFASKDSTHVFFCSMAD